MSPGHEEFEQRLAEVAPLPMAERHRTVTLARAVAVQPRRRRVAPETRRLVAAAAAVVLMLAVRSTAAASLVEQAGTATRPRTHDAQRWARYVQEVRMAIAQEAWQTMDTPAPELPTAVPAQTSSIDPGVAWV